MLPQRAVQKVAPQKERLVLLMLPQKVALLMQVLRPELQREKLVL